MLIFVAGGGGDVFEKDFGAPGRRGKQISNDWGVDAVRDLHHVHNRVGECPYLRKFKIFDDAQISVKNFEKEVFIYKTKNFKNIKMEKESKRKKVTLIVGDWRELMNSTSAWKCHRRTSTPSTRAIRWCGSLTTTIRDRVRSPDIQTFSLTWTTASLKNKQNVCFVIFLVYSSRRSPIGAGRVKKTQLLFTSVCPAGKHKSPFNSPRETWQTEIYICQKWKGRNGFYL